MDGAELKKRRIARRDTTRSLGEALGVSAATISRWETGERQIRPAFRKLLDLFFQMASPPPKPKERHEPRRRKVLTTKKRAHP